MTMRKTLIEIIAIAALVTAVIILAVCLHKSMKNTSRMKSDFETELKRDYAAQQGVTRKELKRYFADEVAKLKEFGVRPGQVENIVNVEYRYIDSVRYKDTLVWVYDTLKNAHTATFDVFADCYTVSGEICGDTLEIRSFEHNDDILLSLYKERRKCLFEKRKIRAIAISGCSGDTLKIMRNIKVSR